MKLSKLDQTFFWHSPKQKANKTIAFLPKAMQRVGFDRSHVQLNLADCGQAWVDFSSQAIPGGIKKNFLSLQPQCEFVRN